jgi:steroid 5-alpha reductase family enzyme
VLRRGKDARFDTMRGSCAGFFGFWVFQMVWAFGVSLPVIFINGSPAASSPAFGAAGDIVGVILFVIGLVTQTVADLQKDAFRSSPDSRGRACTVGLWGWSRHPNFFGEMLMWWGAFVLASPSFGPSAALNSTFGWGAATVISPLLTFAILMFLSGMPTAEGDNQKRYMRTRRARDEFVAYRERTSPVVPLPPPLYKALPGWAKAVFLFEWPMYATSWDVVEEAPAARRASASGKDASGANGFQARAAVPQAEQPPPPPPPAE